MYSNNQMKRPGTIENSGYRRGYADKGNVLPGNNAAAAEKTVGLFSEAGHDDEASGQQKFDRQMEDYLQRHLGDLRKRLFDFDRMVSEAVAEAEKSHKNEMDSARRQWEEQDKKNNWTIEAQQRQIKGKEDEIKRLEDAKQRLERDKGDMGKKIRNLNEQLSILQEGYSSFEDAYAVYCGLPSDIRSGLGEALGQAGDRISFICGIVQEKNLDSAWQYIKHVLAKGKAGTREAESLKQLFLFAFAAVGKSSVTPAYELILPRRGQEYSSLTMGRCAQSPQMGQVIEILLPGYKYSNSGKIIHPAVVLLG